MSRKNIVETVAIVVIILFCYAAVNKLANVALFRSQLEKSPLLAPFASILSWLVPTTEMAIALMLAFNVTRTAALYLSLLLMVLFTTYIIIILNFSYYIPCSCGGVLQGLSWKAHLIFNVAYLLLIILGIINQSKGQKSNSPISTLKLFIPGEAENL